MAKSHLRLEAVKLRHSGESIRDIANKLGLSDNELAKLMYLDNSDILYLVQGQHVQGVNPDQANEETRRLLE